MHSHCLQFKLNEPAVECRGNILVCTSGVTTGAVLCICMPNVVTEGVGADFQSLQKWFCVPLCVHLCVQQKCCSDNRTVLLLSGASAPAELVGQGPTVGGSVGGCCAEPHHTPGGGRRSSSSVCQCITAQKRLSRSCHPPSYCPQPH